MTIQQQLNLCVTRTQHEEGYSKFPYKCPKGYWTIGIGMNMENGEFSDEQITNFWKYGISLEDALKWTLEKYRKIDFQLSRIQIYNTLNYARQGVLMDMTYNMGLVTLLTFNQMFAALKRQDYAGAAQEMLWNNLTKKIKTEYYIDVKGRAEELANIMSTGVWN